VSVEESRRTVINSVESRIVFRTAWVVPVLLGCLAGCGSVEVPEPSADPVSAKVYRAGTTPEQTVEQYLEAQREGNNEALRVNIYPDDSPYELAGPVEIKSFQILRKQVLTAAEAAVYITGPPRREGDVMLEVYEEYARGRTSQNEYFLREYNGVWRIYTFSFQP
jgi:hypothetical protein